MINMIINARNVMQNAHNVMQNARNMLQRNADYMQHVFCCTQRNAKCMQYDMIACNMMQQNTCNMSPVCMTTHSLSA